MFKWWPFFKKEKKRSFASAKTTRILADWKTTDQPFSEILRLNLCKLRQRSRDLEKNNDYFRKYLKLLEVNVIGHKGIKYQSKIKLSDGTLDTDKNNEIERIWAEFSKKENFSACQTLNARQLSVLIVKSIARDGEAILWWIRGADNDFKLSLKMIDPISLDDELEIKRLNNGNRVFNGVEIDKLGKPVNYFFKTTSPGGDFTHRGKRFTIIPAENIIHVFHKTRIDQYRGVPAAASAMIRFHLLEQYELSELIGARVASNKMGFFTSDSGDGYTGEDIENDKTIITESSPGSFEQLPSGVQFTAFDPSHPNTNAPEYVKSVLRGATAGLGMSYNSIANNLEGVNFSSLRQAAIEDRDNYRFEQQKIIDDFLEPVINEVIKQAILLQSLNNRFINVKLVNTWKPRGWMWVNPKNEVDAAVKAIDAKIDSKTNVLSTTGKDYEEIITDLASEKDIEEQILGAPLGDIED